MYSIQKDSHFYAGLFYFGIFRHYPQNPNYNGKVFYTNFAIWMLIIWCGNLGGIILTSIMDLVEGNYKFLTEDIGWLTAINDITLCLINFTLNHKKWSEFFKSVTTYGKYGEPPSSSKIKKFGDLSVILIILYTVLAVMVYALAAFLDEESCEKIFNGRRVCGVLNPTWGPGNIISVKMKRFILAYHCMADFTIFSCFCVMALIVCHSVELIVKRAQHLRSIFKEICKIDDVDEQLLAFNDWIRYHQDTISLCEKLNLVTKSTAGHIFLTVTILLACFGYILLNVSFRTKTPWLNFTLCIPLKLMIHQLELIYFYLFEESTPKTITFFCGYLSVVATYCHAGQQMQDEMMGIGDAIFASDWYVCGQKTKKLIPFVIFRSQYRNGLDALPIGRADYLLFVMIVKTSYSYLTLLNQFM